MPWPQAYRYFGAGHYRWRMRCKFASGQGDLLTGTARLKALALTLASEVGNPRVPASTEVEDDLALHGAKQIQSPFREKRIATSHLNPASFIEDGRFVLRRERNRLLIAL